MMMNAKNLVIYVGTCIAFLAAISFSMPSFAGQETIIFTAKVVRVLDGDTLDIEAEGRRERIRLACVDAPEMGQPYGPNAWLFARNLAWGRRVQIRVYSRGYYGRLIADVILSRGRDLARELVAAGLAWALCGRLRSVEARARKTQRGLWAQESPIPPRRYRRYGK